MFGKKSTKPQSRIDSLIGHGTRIEGDILFSGGLRVDGEVIGNVRAEVGQASTLVLSEQARVEGAIEVSHLVVNGTLPDRYMFQNMSNFRPNPESQVMSTTKRWKCMWVRLLRENWCIRRNWRCHRPKAIEGSIVVD